MDRYISTVTMNSVSRVARVESVVGVVILGGLALLHARLHCWRRASSGSEANPQAAYGFAEV